jgi:formylglycine-generating enzyme required for sulfatase activity
MKMTHLSSFLVVWLCAPALRAKDREISFPALEFMKARDGSAPLRGPIVKKDLISAMKFVKVPKGTFWMGGGSDENDNRNRKKVEIKEDFELAAFTVTQQQWQAVMGKNPSYFSRTGGGKDKVKETPDEDLKRFPVEQVSWDDVQAFLKKLNEMQKGKGWQYRLPSEAEWEYACRNAATTKEECSFDFYFQKPTNDLSSRQANFNGNYPAGQAEKGPSLGRPAKVGSYSPNKLGLYDMHGNVYQWCSDFWDEKGSRRVVRGCSWNLNAYNCRAAERRGSAPTLHKDFFGYLGVRLVRVPSK